MAKADNKLYITAHGTTRTATLVDNASTKALKELLSEGPVTINMHDYGGFEKVGDLPQSLVRCDEDINTVPGDIILYLGRQFVIYYGTNSWNFTRLGKVDNATAANIKEFLGNGNVDVTLSLNDTAGIENILADHQSEDKVFDIMGRPVNHRPLAPGMYIVNGKKTIIR